MKQHAPAALALAGALAVAGAREARAESRPAALSWVRAPGAEGCIGARALGVAVEARLGGGALVPASRAEVSIEGRVAPADGGGWEVTLTVADAGGKVLGTRALSREGADCHAIDEEITLMVALLIDPDAALAAPPARADPVAPSALAEPGATRAEPAAKGGTPEAPPRVSVERAPVATPGSKAWNAAFLAGPVVSFGALPNVGIGAQVRALVTPSRYFSFQVGGSVWAPSTASFGESGGRFFMALGALSGCPLGGVALGFRYAACLGVEAGAIRAGGFGFPLSLETDKALVNGLLESRVVRKLAGPFAASLGIGLSVPFLRQRFYYIDSAGEEREVFLASPVTGQVDVLVGFDL